MTDTISVCTRIHIPTHNTKNYPKNLLDFLSVLIKRTLNVKNRFVSILIKEKKYIGYLFLLITHDIKEE